MNSFACKPRLERLCLDHMVRSRTRPTTGKLVVQVTALRVSGEGLPVSNACSKYTPGKERALFRLISELCEHNVSYSKSCLCQELRYLTVLQLNM